MDRLWQLMEEVVVGVATVGMLGGAAARAAVGVEAGVVVLVALRRTGNVGNVVSTAAPA